MTDRVKPRKIHETMSDRVFNVVNYLILTFVLVVVLYPLIYVLSASFSDAQNVLAGKVYLWPVGLSFDGYIAVFRHELVMTGYLNSIFYTVVGTFVNVTMTFIAAYPLSRKDFYGRGAITVLFTVTMFISGGLIPGYLLVRDLGLINTRLAMIIPGAMSVWNVILTRTFLQSTIPDELLEAARMDNCDDFTFLTRIVLPLSTPVIAVISLNYAVGHWNSFFSGLIYLNDSALYPLQLVLRDILVKNSIPAGMIVDPVLQQRMDNVRELLKYALIVVATLPVLIIYPFVQKYFVKGVMIGAIKG